MCTAPRKIGVAFTRLMTRTFLTLVKHRWVGEQVPSTIDNGRSWLGTGRHGQVARNLTGILSLVSFFQVKVTFWKELFL